MNFHRFHENLWKSMKICQNLSISMKRSPSKSRASPNSIKFPIKFYQILSKSMKIHKNQWKSMKINKKSIKVNQNLSISIKRSSSKSSTFHPILWKSIQIYQNPSKSMKISLNGSNSAHHDPSTSIKFHQNRWDFARLLSIDHHDVDFQDWAFLQTHGIGTAITCPSWID